MGYGLGTGYGGFGGINGFIIFLILILLVFGTGFHGTYSAEQK